MIKLNNEFEVGETVFDDLTGSSTKVIGISFARGFVNDQRNADNKDNIGYWIDNPYLSGGRHPWELSKICTNKNVFEKLITSWRKSNG